MAPREVIELRIKLNAIVNAAKALSHQLEDLHVYAYDRPAGGDVKVGGGDNNGGDPLDIGNQKARAIWSGLDARLTGVQTAIVSLNSAVGNLLSAGPSAEVTRGTLIRSAGELKKAIKRQARRAAEGEYTPHRMMDQPPYPGARG